MAENFPKLTKNEKHPKKSTLGHNQTSENQKQKQRILKSSKREMPFYQYRENSLNDSRFLIRNRGGGRKGAERSSKTFFKN